MSTFETSSQEMSSSSSDGAHSSKLAENSAFREAENEVISIVTKVSRILISPFFKGQTCDFYGNFATFEDLFTTTYNTVGKLQQKTFTF